MSRADPAPTEKNSTYSGAHNSRPLYKCPSDKDVQLKKMFIIIMAFLSRLDSRPIVLS